MSISDKTRKVLWARSGNRCAICRHKLVVDENDLDKESVVGEECHICSQSPKGPRYDSTLNVDKIDCLDNLILLCSTHHKVIDDQVETYAKTCVYELKANHEKWVEEKFNEKNAIPPIKIRRLKENIPSRLNLVTSGKALMGMASYCVAAYHDYCEDLNDAEIDLVGGFFQNIRDYMDIWSDIEPIAQVRAAKEISDSILELLEHGFLVFAASELQRLEGGTGGPSNWEVLHLTIARVTDSGVQFQDALDKTLNESEESPPLQQKENPLQ